jgi:NitT/TauT family transport system substrate-binding protein
MLVASVFGIKVALPVGPTLFSVVPLIEKRIPTEETYEFVFWKTFDEAIALIARRQTDYIFLPVSYGATLFGKGLPVQLQAVSLWKTFYSVSKNWKYNDISSFIGETVYLTQGKGQTADVTVRLLLAEAGIDADKDVSLKYISPSEIVSFMEKGVANIAVVPEPYVSLILSRIPDVAISFDLDALWKESFGSTASIPITGFFYIKTTDNVSGTPIDKTYRVLEDIKLSVTYLLQNTEEVVSLALKSFPGMKTEVLIDSLKRSTFDFSFGAETNVSVRDYLFLLNSKANETMPILPDENFYLE